MRTLIFAILISASISAQEKTPSLEIDVIKIYEAVLTNGYESDEVYRYLLWRYTNRPIPDTVRIRELEDKFCEFKRNKKI